jgi:hypothetical protein
MTTMIMPMMPIFALPWCSVPCIVSIPLELFQFALGGMETGVCTTSSLPLRRGQKKSPSCGWGYPLFESSMKSLHQTDV